MKKVFGLLIILFMVTGCFNNKINQNDGIERIYLTDSYYNNGNFVEVNDLNNLDNDTYVVFAYNNFCNFSVPCDKIFESFMTKYDIDFIKIPFDKFKETYLYDEVKYAPTIIVVSEGKVITYLDANKDEDLDKYQDEKAFEKWLNNYIYFTKKN